MGRGPGQADQVRAGDRGDEEGGVHSRQGHGNGPRAHSQFSWRLPHRTRLEPTNQRLLLSRRVSGLDHPNQRPTSRTTFGVYCATDMKKVESGLGRTYP